MGFIDYNNIIDSEYYSSDNRTLINLVDSLNDHNRNNTLVTTVEGITTIYALSIILNKRFFSYSDYGNRLNLLYSDDTVDNTIMFLYKLLSTNEIDKELLKKPLGYSKPYTVQHAIEGSVDDKTLFRKFNMCDLQTGMKEFLSYAAFLILVKRNEYDAALEITKEIEPLRFISYWFEHNNTRIITECFIEELETKCSKSIISNGIETAIASISAETYELYIESFINLMVGYYRILSNEKHKSYILGLISLFPRNTASSELFRDLAFASSVQELNKLTKEFKANSIDEEEYTSRIETMTQNDDRKGVEDSLSVKYPYINFDNLSSNSKLFIATGDYVQSILDTSKKDIDYSAATIEWCKAVENETRIKIFNLIENTDDDTWKTLKKDLKKVLYLGSAKTIRDNCFETVYCRILKQKYNNLSPDTFRTLLTMLFEFSDKYRNDSAHVGNLDRTSAVECHSLSLDSEKIIEILSSNAFSI